jgi:hypothetical protein
MKASSVGEYLVLFGALVAVVGTAVISLGRLIVFQAETAEQKYSQSIADELASAINEISASPDGSYYVLQPTRTSYNISLTDTRVILRRNGEQVVSTHLGRSLIPTELDSTDTLCIQKSLGKILIKTGECLSCSNSDGFCDAGCDALGICDEDCNVGGDGYCSRSCSVIRDDRCDLDCVGKSDGIWDPDCGCIKGSDDPCVEDGVCDLDSGVLDFAWDPDCTGADGVCDPDYDQGCDPDCVTDSVCRGTCASDPSMCFPACNNPPCNDCKYACAPGCSSKPGGWYSDFVCGGELPNYQGNSTLPLFLKISPQTVVQNCSINATEFQLFYLGKEQAIGPFFEQGNIYLVYIPQNTGGKVYMDEGSSKGIFVTDLWGANNTIVNEFMKIKVENGTIVEAVEMGNNEVVGINWGREKEHNDVENTVTSSNLTVADVGVQSDSGLKKYQMFSGLPGVRVISNYVATYYYDFPTGYSLSSEGTYGYANGFKRMMLYCGGSNVLVDKDLRRLSCTTDESWIFLCSNCDTFKNWLNNNEVQVKNLMNIANTTGYSQYC